MFELKYNLKDHVSDNQYKWDMRFLNLAKHISLWSKDPSTKCGAVIVDNDNRVISTGYNGFPTGIDDTDERYNNREIKYGYVVHADMNSILFSHTSLEDLTIYTYPLPPCSRCTVHVIQSKLGRIVSAIPGEDILSRWGEDLIEANKLLEEAGRAFCAYNIDDIDLFYMKHLNR